MRSFGSDTFGKGSSLGNSIFLFLLLLSDSNSDNSISDLDFVFSFWIGWKNCLILPPSGSSSTTSVTTLLKNPERSSAKAGCIDELGVEVEGELEGDVELGVEGEGFVVVDDDVGVGVERDDEFDELSSFCLFAKNSGSSFLYLFCSVLILLKESREEGF